MEKSLALLILLTLLIAGCSQPAVAEPDDSVYLPLIGNDMWSPTGNEESEWNGSELVVRINNGKVIATCTNGAWGVDYVYGQDGLDKQVVLLGNALEAELNTGLVVWANNASVVDAYNYCVSTVTKE